MVQFQFQILLIAISHMASYNSRNLFVVVWNSVWNSELSISRNLKRIQIKLLFD